ADVERPQVRGVVVVEAMPVESKGAGQVGAPERKGHDLLEEPGGVDGRPRRHREGERRHVARRAAEALPRDGDLRGRDQERENGRDADGGRGPGGAWSL